MPEVVAAVPPDVATVVTANTGGGSSISALLDPPATLPTSWRIVTPAPAASLLAAYHEAEAASGIPWPYLAAINLVETRMGRIVGDSTAGAQGPMQFIPSTWRAYGRGGDVHDPRDAILAAGRYLAAAGGPKDMDAALRAYNHADAYVDAVKRYASVMAADERAFLGYYQWQVLFRTTDGLFLLPEGYPGDGGRPPELKAGPGPPAAAIRAPRGASSGGSCCRSDAPRCWSGAWTAGTARPECDARYHPAAQTVGVRSGRSVFGRSLDSPSPHELRRSHPFHQPSDAHMNLLVTTQTNQPGTPSVRASSRPSRGPFGTGGQTSSTRRRSSTWVAPAAPVHCGMVTCRPSWGECNVW